MRLLNTSSSGWLSWSETIIVVEIAVAVLGLCIIVVESLVILVLLYR